MNFSELSVSWSLAANSSRALAVALADDEASKSEAYLISWMQLIPLLPIYNYGMFFGFLLVIVHL
jgi:hypothetical protein